MPVREIKTTLALDGEKQFDAAIKEASRSLRVMDADLKAISAEFKATGNEQLYFTQRSETLHNEIRQQEQIVEALAKAVKESADAYGDASAKTDGYRIKLSNATAKLYDMRREAETTDQQLEELGRDSQKIGRQIENGIGDAAEDTSRKLDDMISKITEDIGSIRGSATFSVFSDISGGIMDTVQGLDSFAEGTREYRRSLSYLEQNAQTFDMEFESLKEQLFEIASLTGEVDSSVEGLSNLMAAGLDIDEVAVAVDLLAGAVIRFPDTLKFESLADGLQETLATGEATGAYAELLERLGVNLEEFNQALADAEDAEEKQQIALAYLTKNGLATAYESYKANNEELLKAEEATLRWNDAMAELGGHIDEYLAPVKLAIAEIVGDFNTLIEKGAEAAYGMTDEEFWTETAMKTGTVHNTNVEAPGFVESLQNIGSGIMNWLVPSAGAEEIPPEWGEYGADAFGAYEDGLTTAAENSTAATDAVDLVVETLDSGQDAAETAGENVSISLANGIALMAPQAIDNAVDMVEQINAVLNQIAVPSLSWGGMNINGFSTGGSISLTGDLNIDSQKAGTYLASSVSSAQGRKVNTTMLVK